MKSQTLPWFVINIVGTVTFIIVLIAILTMQKNLYFTVKNLDASMARMLFERTLIVSPNCLAYEPIKYSFKNGNYILEHHEYEGIIDLRKFEDFYHFNCLRYDLAWNNQTSYVYELAIRDLVTNHLYDERSYYYNGPWYSSNNEYYDVIPITLFNGTAFHPAILYITIGELGNESGQKFCEMKS